MEKAREFLSLPEDCSAWPSEAWDLLRDPDVFLSVEWGEETGDIIDKWNALVPGEFAIVATPDDADTPAGFTHHLSCSTGSLDVPYRASREDCMIVVLTINALVKGRIELRLSRVSTGNSDWSYLPLSDADWASLEAEYGADRVNRAFVRLAESWDALESALGAA